MRGTARAGVVVVGAAALVLLVSPKANAHCDGIDGPVVTAARSALDSGKVGRVLIWVRPADEAEVQRAFELTRSVRQGGPAVRELADRYFFETVVRLHRAGEGEPFTGLKPAGRDLGPAIPAADAAIESGSVDALTELLTTDVSHAIAARFSRTLDAKRRAASGDLAAGREYVAAYVALLHYVDQLHADSAATDTDTHERR